MKTSLIFNTFLLTLLAVNVAAKDFKNPHKLKPGDVISSDVMNELFDYVASSKATATESTLLGTWTCDSYLMHAYSDTGFPGLLAGDNVLSSYFPVDNLYVYQPSGNVTFSDDGDGTFSLSTTKQPFLCQPDFQGTPPFHFRVVKGALVMNFNIPYELPVWYAINLISKDRITFKKIVGSHVAGLVTCDRNDLPPINPEGLSYSLSGTNATLNWSDKSTDETSFIILRKDSLNGSWVEVDSVASNVTTYADSLVSGNTYWYRIKSSNGSGKSLGTSVIKITVP